MNTLSPSTVRQFFSDMIGEGKRFRYRTECAAFLGLTASKATKFYKFLDGADTGFSAVFEWLSRFDVVISAPEKKSGAARDVCFVDARLVAAGENAPPPQAIDYMAAPLVGEAGAGPGYLPQNEIKSWFLVYKHQAAVRYRRNLIAVELGHNSTSMQPTLNPGDIVLIDRDDRDVSQSGHMMLVLDPMDGSGMIKRVAVTDLENGDFRITYYSDNTLSNPPMVYSLKKDFGNDWEKTIVGRVVWAWSDMKEK